MVRPDTLFLALTAVWVASEFWIGRKRAHDGGKAHDRGSLQLLHVAIWGSIIVAVWLSRETSQLCIADLGRQSVDDNS